MQIRRLALHQLRRFSAVDLSPQPGLNLLTGDNGAGKTSVLEALHLMAYGRSFRGRVRDGLVRQGQEALEIFVEWDEQRANHPPHRRKAGLRHSGQDWKGRLDGEDVAQLGNLCAALAVVTFEPGSHALVSGGGEPRRRFLDWGLFHVEPDFLSLWRRYSRALKQRNALLKQAAPRMLDTWDHELAEAGEPLTSRRQHYLERLQQRTVALAASWRRSSASRAWNSVRGGVGMSFLWPMPCFWHGNVTARPVTPRSGRTGPIGRGFPQHSRS